MRRYEANKGELVSGTFRPTGTYAFQHPTGTGPYNIINNHLEGASENVMFGGADPDISNLVPADIEARSTPGGGGERIGAAAQLSDPDLEQLAALWDALRKKAPEIGIVDADTTLRLNKPDRSRWDDRKLDHVRPYLDAAAAEAASKSVAVQVL